MIPIYFACYVLFSVANGALTDWEAWSQYQPTQLALFCVGVVVTILGVVNLSLNDKSQHKSEASDGGSKSDSSSRDCSRDSGSINAPLLKR